MQRARILWRGLWSTAFWRRICFQMSTLHNCTQSGLLQFLRNLWLSQITELVRNTFGNSILTSHVSPGDPCKTAADCYGLGPDSCPAGVCVGGPNCTISTQCNEGQFCQAGNCVPLKDLVCLHFPSWLNNSKGEYCEFDEDCKLPYICSVDHVCVEMFTKAKGEPCDDFLECGGNWTCNSVTHTCGPAFEAHPCVDSCEGGKSCECNTFSGELMCMPAFNEYVLSPQCKARYTVSASKIPVKALSEFHPVCWESHVSCP